jgi:hypothetical protein
MAVGEEEMKKGERNRSFPRGCARGEGSLHFAAVFAVTARAATVALASAKCGCSAVEDTAGDGLRTYKCHPYI